MVFKKKKVILWLYVWFTPCRMEGGDGCKGEERGLCLLLLQTFGCQQTRIIQRGPDITMVSGYRDTNVGIDFRIIWQKEQAREIKTYGFSYDLISTSFMSCSAQHIILQIQILSAVTRDGQSEKHPLLSARLHLLCHIKHCLFCHKWSSTRTL